jgi:hypothetical protein
MNLRFGIQLSTVNIATDRMTEESVVDSYMRKMFSLSHWAKTGSGDHPGSFYWVMGAPFWDEAAGLRS